MPGLLAGYLRPSRTPMTGAANMMDAIRRVGLAQQAHEEAAGRKMNQMLGLVPQYMEGDPAAQAQLAMMGAGVGMPKPYGVQEEEARRQEQIQEYYRGQQDLARAREGRAEEGFERAGEWRREDIERRAREREEEAAQKAEEHKGKEAAKRQEEVARMEAWESVMPGLPVEVLEGLAKQGAPSAGLIATKAQETKRKQQSEDVQSAARFLRGRDAGPMPERETLAADRLKEMLGIDTNVDLGRWLRSIGYKGDLGETGSEISLQDMMGALGQKGAEAGAMSKMFGIEPEESLRKTLGLGKAPKEEKGVTGKQLRMMVEFNKAAEDPAKQQALVEEYTARAEKGDPEAVAVLRWAYKL